MNTADGLIIFAAVVATAGALWNLFQIYRKVNAEEELRRSARAKLKATAAAARRHPKRRRGAIGPQGTYPANARSLRQLQEVIEQFLAQLPEPERRLILQGLHQPSEKGRLEYARKLVEAIYAEEPKVPEGPPREPAGTAPV